MSTPTRETVTAVPVHIQSSSVKLGGDHYTPTGKIYRTTYNTLLVTTAAQAEPILAASNNREIAWIQPLDDDMVVHSVASDAARGNGTRIPKANNAPYPIQDSGTVFVAFPTIAGSSSRVSISAVYCEPNTVANQEVPGAGYESADAESRY